MRVYSEMTYDEQRAALGLWEPDIGFHFQRAIRDVRRVFAPIIAALSAPALNSSDLALAGEA